MAWGKGDAKRIRGHAWMRIRHRIQVRDKYRCQTCLRAGRHAPPDPSNEVDHVVPLCQGGTNRDDNLEIICSECHIAKTTREAGHAPRRAVGVDGNPSGGW